MIQYYLNNAEYNNIFETPLKIKENIKNTNFFFILLFSVSNKHSRILLR